MNDNILNQLLGINLNSPIETGASSAQTNAELIVGLVRNGLILLFVVIVIAAIFYAALSGLKFVRSQGASDQVEEAQESIKYTLIGVGVAFIGVILVVLIASVFQPNSSADISLRCVFGDFNLCSAQAPRMDGANTTCSAGFTLYGDCAAVDGGQICIPDSANANEICNQ